jgi:hypothetical protein
MGALASYDPRSHAQMVGESVGLLQDVAQRLARVEGLLERMAAAAVTKHDSSQLDRLVVAAFDAMGGKYWAVSDLLGRAIKGDPAGLALLSAITSTGVLESSARSLGRYLAERVRPGELFTTADGGLQLLRGLDGRLVVWSIQQVV